MHFFVQKPESGTISGSDIQHLKSMRIKTGDVIKITDLNGRLYEVKISQINGRYESATFEVMSAKEAYKQLKYTLIQARMDKVYMEKLVEILPHGRFEKMIIFESKNSPKQNLNLDRLDKILVRSCLQSEVCYKPEIKLVNNSLSHLLTEYKPVVLDLVADKNNSEGGMDSSSILVGPEGGFSHDEKGLFVEHKSPMLSFDGIVYPGWLAGFRAASFLEDLE